MSDYLLLNKYYGDECKVKVLRDGEVRIIIIIIIESFN